MSIKVKVGGSKSIRAVPKQETSTPIVAPAEKKPVIVPDSVALGADTTGNYIENINAGNGILITGNTSIEGANLVIHHANTSSEVSSNNQSGFFIQNIDIDEFGHVTSFYSNNTIEFASKLETPRTISITGDASGNVLFDGSSDVSINIVSSDASNIDKGIAFFDANNFIANSGFVSSKEFLIGNTSINLGDSVSSLEGLTSFGIGDIIITNNELAVDGDLQLSATGDVDVDGSKITGLANPVDGSDAVNKTYLVDELNALEEDLLDVADPVLETDATNKRYVDDLALQLITKYSVYGATTEDLNATFTKGNSNVADTIAVPSDITNNLSIDGIDNWQVGDALLIKDQTNANENGRYELIDAGDHVDPWIFRRSEYSDSEQETIASFVFVTNGNTNSDTGWVANVTDPKNFDLGTDDINYNQFHGEGTFTAGRGLTLNDTEFELDYNLTLESINSLVDNIIITTNVLDVNGSGAIILPKGTTAERPSPEEGMVRFNTNDSRFEAYNGTTWTGLGGVVDTDQDTYITAESSPGSDNDELNFVVADNELLKLSTSQLQFGSGLNKFTIDASSGDTSIAGNLNVDGIVNIAGNITLGDHPTDSITVAADFESHLIPNLDATYNLGSATKDWNNLHIRSISSNTGAIDFDMYGGIILPVGDSSQRPPNVIGTIRFNIDDYRFEGFDGTEWSGLGGNITDVDKDTYITAETSSGSDEDELLFVTAGTNRLKIDDNGNFNFGQTLNRVTINYLTGNISTVGKIITLNGAELSTANVQNLDKDRIVYVGDDGKLLTSDLLQFNGSTVRITEDFVVESDASIENLSVTGLPSDRVVFTGPNGSLQTDAGLSYDGNSLTITADVTVDSLTVVNDIDADEVNITGDITAGGTAAFGNLSVDTVIQDSVVLGGPGGTFTSDSNLQFDGSRLVASGIAIPALNQNRIVTVGAGGQLEDDSNLTFDGTNLTVNAAATFESSVEVDSLTIPNLTPQRIVLTGPDGVIEVSDLLQFDGVNLILNGGFTIDGDFSTSGGLSGDSLSVGNLSANTLVFIGEGGVLQSNTSLSFDGTEFVANTIATFNANVEISSLSVSDLTQNRIVTVGTDGELQDSSDLTFDGSSLNVNTPASFNDSVDVSSLSVDDLTSGRIVTVGTDGELQDSADLTFDGSSVNVNAELEVTGDSTFTSVVSLEDDLKLDGAITSDTSDVIAIDTTGAIKVPVGTAAERPANLEAGLVRFNLSDGVFEGYSGAAWASLGGVKDVDQDTYITAEDSPGSDNDELKFFVGGTETLRVSQTQLSYGAGLNKFVINSATGDTNISGNVIIDGLVTIGGNLTLGDQATDSITVAAEFESHLIADADATYNLGSPAKDWNQLHIRTITSNTDTIDFDLSGAITLPVGSTAERPSATVGMIRYNTDDSRFEAYDGSAWTGVGGVIDTDGDTFISAESSAGADNDELQFFVGGEKAFFVSNTGAISTDNGNNLVFDVSGIIDVGNTIITNLAEPVNSSDAVTKNYLENTYERDFIVKDGSNNNVLSLLSDFPTISLDPTLEVTDYDLANNEVQIGLRGIPVDTGIYGDDGFVPKVTIDEYGRVVSAVNIPLSVSSNAVVDFTESIQDTVQEMFRFNTEDGVIAQNDFVDGKIDLFARSYDITLDGDVDGTAQVYRNSNTTITVDITTDYVAEVIANTGIDVNGTIEAGSILDIRHGNTSNVANTTYQVASQAITALTFDEFGHIKSHSATDFDFRYLRLTGGTLTGDIRAPRFVDADNTSYYMDPAGTSRINGLQVGFGGSISQVEFTDSVNGSTFMYGTQGKLGFLNSSFNFATYAERDTSNWVVESGDVKALRFVDFENQSYFLDPAGTDSYLKQLDIESTIQFANNLIIDSDSISTDDELTLNPGNGFIDVSTARIGNLTDPSLADDAATKGYVDSEIDTAVDNSVNAFVGGEGLTYTALSQTFDVNVDDSTIEIVSDILQVKDNGITNEKILNSFINLDGDTGTTNPVNLGETLSILGAEGIDTFVAGNQIVISGELADNTNKGVASFTASNFSVSSGEVSVTRIDGGTF